MSTSIPRIAVDAMGSDMGPEEIVAGVCSLLKEDKSDMEIILVGNEDVLSALIIKYKLVRDARVKIYHASEVIEMHEKPIQAMKTKKDSSMLRAIEMVKVDMADAMLSCGNTGAMMAAGTLKLRPMCGIERPALGTVIPSKDSNFVMIDVGASPDPKPESLLDNAILGANYARIVLGIKNPRVGLLSNGTEDGKGNVLTQRAHKLLTENKDVVNYCGLLEGFGLFANEFDVVVCDGFTGNVVLKSMESAISMLKSIMTEEFKRTWIRKLGILLSIGAFKGVKRRLPVHKFSGAPLLGLNGLIVKAHGSSDRKQLAGALEITLRCLRMEIKSKIMEDVMKIRPELEKKKLGVNGSAGDIGNDSE